jgi:hypothetical protein
MSATCGWVRVPASNLDGSFTVVGWVQGRRVAATCLDHEVRCSADLWERARWRLVTPGDGTSSACVLVVDAPPDRSLSAVFVTFVRACDRVTTAEFTGLPRTARLSRDGLREGDHRPA